MRERATGDAGRVARPVITRGATRQVVGRYAAETRPPGMFEATLHTPTFVVDIRTMRRPAPPHPTDVLWGGSE